MKNYNRYPPRDPIKNYFSIPNEIFCLGLSPGELSVYAYLLFRENRKTYQCYPSYKDIGDALKISRNTVKKYVDSLREKRLIKTEPTQVITKNGEKSNGNLLYTIRPIDEAINYHYGIQLRNYYDKTLLLMMCGSTSHRSGTPRPFLKESDNYYYKYQVTSDMAMTVRTIMILLYAASREPRRGEIPVQRLSKPLLNEVPYRFIYPQGKLRTNTAEKLHSCFCRAAITVRKFKTHRNKVLSIL